MYTEFITKFSNSQVTNSRHIEMKLKIQTSQINLVVINNQ